MRPLTFLMPKKIVNGLKGRLILVLLVIVGLASVFFRTVPIFDMKDKIESDIKKARSLKLEKVSIPGYDDDTEKYFNSMKDNNYMPRVCPINITIFTVFHEGLKTKEVLQNNTLLNWMQLQRHCISPVFYSNNPRDILAGKEFHGWHRHPLSDHMMARNNSILRQLFINTIKKHNTDFYMFAYADLLFHGKALLKTLTLVKNYVRAAKLDYFFISGSRYEVPFHNNHLKFSRKLRIGDDIEFENILPERKPLDKGRLEYFITTKDSFPWDIVPDLLVTTLAPDPLPTFWFPMYANKLGIATIDISQTIFPIRQSGLMPNVMDKKHRTATNLNKFVFIKSFPKYCLYKPVIHSNIIPSISTLDCFKFYTQKGKYGYINMAKSQTFSDQECRYKYPIMIPMLEQGDSLMDIS